MPIIFKTNSCKIEKSKNNYKFIFKDGEKYKHFFEKIKKNISDDIISQKKNESFTVKASKVEGLKDLLKRKKTWEKHSLCTPCEPTVHSLCALLCAFLCCALPVRPLLCNPMRNPLF